MWHFSSAHFATIEVEIKKARLKSRAFAFNRKKGRARPPSPDSSLLFRRLCTKKHPVGRDYATHNRSNQTVPMPPHLHRRPAAAPGEMPRDGHRTSPAGFIEMIRQITPFSVAPAKGPSRSQIWLDVSFRFHSPF
jgi:hypothetical protein